jgi:CheY-like chemotaxis protein
MAKKILLADDSITIQKVVELTFAEGDYEVICASDGAQAIRKIEEIVPDIALVDVMMPQRNGYDVCAHVKKDPNLAWIPVLLLTGTFEPYDPKRAEEVGADGHIIKPFESRALVGQVEELIAKLPRPGSSRLWGESGDDDEAGETTVFDEAAGAQTGPATVRFDSRELIAQASQSTGMGRRAELPEDAAPRSPAPGPLDLGSGPDLVEATHPLKLTPASPPASAAPGQAPARGSTEGTREQIEEIARPIVEEAVERVLREIAWEVIPDLAETIIRRRIRELEEEAGEEGTSLH